MNLETQVKEYKELGHKIDELEEQRKKLGAVILEQMREKTLQVAGYTVRKIERLSFKLSLDEARSLNAVKTEEVIDKDALRALYESGLPIQGVSQIKYIQISNPKNSIEEWAKRDNLDS